MIDVLAENERLRQEIVILQLELASWRGSLSLPSKDAPDPFHVSYVITPPEEGSSHG